MFIDPKIYDILRDNLLCILRRTLATFYDAETMPFKAGSLFTSTSRITAMTATRPVAQIHVPRCLHTNWKGAGTEDHGVNRVKKGDTGDPETEGIAAGQREKAEADKDKERGKRDQTKSQATSEKPQPKSKETAEKEFPEAPRPIIGMTDERGKVSRISCCQSRWLN